MSERIMFVRPSKRFGMKLLIFYGSVFLFFLSRMVAGASVCVGLFCN